MKVKMNTVDMHLDQKYFLLMQSQKKNFEVRLADDKRRSIHVGDYIHFINSADVKDSFIVPVKKIMHFNSFQNFTKSTQEIKMGVPVSELANDLYAIYGNRIDNSGIIVFYFS